MSSGTDASIRDIIEKKFGKYPAQEKVVKLVFERGFQISPEGKVVSGGIELPHVQVGREIGVDRRVVDGAAKRIAADKELFELLRHMRSIAFLRDAAPFMGLGVVIIVPDDGADIGIISSVTAIISSAGYSIRQAVSDDPFLTVEPRLTIITNGILPGDVVNRIKQTKGVKGVSIY